MGPVPCQCQAGLDRHLFDDLLSRTGANDFVAGDRSEYRVEGFGVYERRATRRGKEAISMKVHLRKGFTII